MSALLNAAVETPNIPFEYRNDTLQRISLLGYNPINKSTIAPAKQQKSIKK